MFLKFIGRDNSMGLKKGGIYRVNIVSHHGYVWVYWGFNKRCPYSSPSALAENWSKP